MEIIIIQARMTSTRLPGKILLEVLGKPLLEYLIERLRQVPSKPEIWVATTLNKTDDPVVELANKLNVKVFRGDENDVLDRYYKCAKEAGAKTIIRVTGDCPLIDPDVIERVIQEFRASTPRIQSSG